MTNNIKNALVRFTNQLNAVKPRPYDCRSRVASSSCCLCNLRAHFKKAASRPKGKAKAKVKSAAKAEVDGTPLDE